LHQLIPKDIDLENRINISIIILSMDSCQSTDDLKKIYDMVMNNNMGMEVEDR